MKKAIKERTGKTEAECEDIIAQYRKLRAKAKVNNAKRTEKLKSNDDLITGTNVITPVAQIEKDAEIVKAKIEKQVEQIENKAEREVVKKDKTKDEVKVEVEQKVVKQLAKLSDEMVSSATTFVKNIQTELKKVDKTEAKNFLLGLRNEIDALLSKFGDGGGISKFNNGGEVKEKIVKKFAGYYEDYRGEHVVSLVKEEDGSGYYFLDTTNGFTGGFFKEKSRTKDALERYVRKNYMVVSKFEDGGTIETYNITENESASSVNPSLFARGGGVNANNNDVRVKALIKNLDNTPYSIGLAILRERLLTYTENDLRVMEKKPTTFDNPIISRGMYKDYFNRVIEELKFDYENGGEVGEFAKGGGVTKTKTGAIKLYYHQTSGGAEYLSSSKVKGTKDEGSMDSEYIVRIDGAKDFGGELFTKVLPYAKGGGVGNPSKKQMLDYLNMYFDNYSELRTIAIEKDNILTRRMLNSLDNEELQMAYDDAKYEIKAETQFARGGGVEDIDYNEILEVLKEKLEDSVQELPIHYENADNFKGEEVEHESRDGFIPYTNGGYEVTWFEFVYNLGYSGYSLPTSQLDIEMQRQMDYNDKIAKDRFVEEYAEIVEELGIDNIDYHSLYEAGYESEAEQLSEWEMNYDADDSILCEIGAYYYDTENYRGIDGKNTIRLYGLVNLESPYHRRGNLDDSYDIDITFDSISELKEKIDAGLKEITNWFDGKYYKDSNAEMKITRMAKGGGIYSSDELYILKVYDLNDNLVDSSKRIFAKNLTKAKEIAISDYESDMHKKYGRDLRFRIEKAPSMMAKGGGVGSRNLDGLETEIHQLKRKLVRQAKLKGISENFGQKEVRMLEDKYPMNFSVGQFDEWVQNFDLNSYAKGGVTGKDNRAKKVVRNVNGFRKEFPIGDAWRKDHNQYNKSQKHEIPTSSRKS